MQEVQSSARVGATNLVIGKEVKEILQVNCEKMTPEKEEEKQDTYKLEKKLAEVYNNIPDYA
jgi:NifU-like protein involved in Fe-S cluster formation